MVGWNILNRSWRLSSALLEAANATMLEHHLHSKSLMVLGAYQHLSHPSEVSKHLHIPMPTLSNIHRELERHGYLTKKVDGIDRRRHVIQVTEEGQKIFDLCIFEVCKAFDERQTSLSAKNQDAILQNISSLMTLMDKEEDQQNSPKPKASKSKSKTKAQIGLR